MENVTNNDSDTFSSERSRRNFSRMIQSIGSILSRGSMPWKPRSHRPCQEYSTGFVPGTTAPHFYFWLRNRLMENADASMTCLYHSGSWAFFVAIAPLYTILLYFKLLSILPELIRSVPGTSSLVRAPYRRENPSLPKPKRGSLGTQLL